MLLRRTSLPVLAALALTNCADSVSTIPPEDVQQDVPSAEDAADVTVTDVTVTDVGDAGMDAPVDVPVTMDVPVDVRPDVPPSEDRPTDIARDTPVTTDVGDGGGACTTPVNAPPPRCSPSVCGNGRVDTCQECRPCFPPGGGPPPPRDAGVCCTDVSEECDGTITGSVTCASLGFAGGTLRCGSWCGHDTTGCNSCEISARVSSCVQADVDAVAPSSLALATNGTDVAIAWVSGRNADGTTGVHFARYDAALNRVAETRCLGLADANWVDVAATPSGWMLAASNATQTNLYAFGAAALPGAPTRTITGATVPQFAGRADGGPLLRWFSGSGAQAVILRPDGTDATAPVTVFSSTIEPGYGSAVFTGDGFLLAERENSTVAVVRVDLNGRVANRTAPLGASTEYPQLAWTGTEARLTVADFGRSAPGVVWTRLDRMGAPLGAPIVLGTIPQYFNPTPMVADGNDTIAALGAYTGTTGGYARVEIGRVTATGSIASQVTINRDRNQAARVRIVRRGSVNVVAWIGGGFPGRIMLANVVI